MTNMVYLICGVPGSGKTWVCERLLGQFTYVAHDDHMKDFVNAIWQVAQESDFPIVSECPFAERLIKGQLEAKGLTIIPLFIVEDSAVIERRYNQRSGKVFPKSHATRSVSILSRAIEWGAFHGTSEEVLDRIKKGG